MGEMVGEVTLICGRVAEREIGGCSSARYRDPIVSYSEPLQGPSSSLAQLQLPITASAARQAVVIDVHNVHQQSWEPHCEAGRDSGNTP